MLRESIGSCENQVPDTCRFESHSSMSEFEFRKPRMGDRSDICWRDDTKVQDSVISIREDNFALQNAYRPNSDVLGQNNFITSTEKHPGGAQSTKRHDFSGATQSPSHQLARLIHQAFPIFTPHPTMNISNNKVYDKSVHRGELLRLKGARIYHSAYSY